MKTLNNAVNNISMFNISEVYYGIKDVQSSSKQQYLQCSSNYQQLLRQSRSPPLKNHRLFLRKRNAVGFLMPPVFYLELVSPYGKQGTTG